MREHVAVQSLEAASDLFPRALQIIEPYASKHSHGLQGASSSSMGNTHLSSEAHLLGTSAYLLGGTDTPSRSAPPRSRSRSSASPLVRTAAVGKASAQGLALLAAARWDLLQLSWSHRMHHRLGLGWGQPFRLGLSPIDNSQLSMHRDASPSFNGKYNQYCQQLYGIFS